MNQTLKNFSLSILKNLGLFALSKWITKNQLRILCYHGVALKDEHLFRPSLFMRSDTFKKRMEYLNRSEYKVIPLESIDTQLDSTKYLPYQVIITIDDGWYGTYLHMVPEMEKYAFSSTLYLSTYHLKNQYPVYEVAVAYLLWKYKKPFIFSENSKFKKLGNPPNKLWTEEELLELGKSLKGFQEQILLEELCVYFGEDYENWKRERKFFFLNEDEAKTLGEKKVDIQLHTHRHTLSDSDYTEAEREIVDNKKCLQEITKKPLLHFCYPSGEFSSNQFSWLKKIGLLTATTTKNDLVRKGDNPYALSRIMDSETVSMIEFEAEISGFLPLIRRFFNR